MLNPNLQHLVSLSNDNSKQVAVILPAYNEELTIESTIRSFYNELPQAAIWVIDNKSNDLTQQIARNVITTLNCKGGIIYEERKGKGNAIRRAFRDIEADIYVLADADLTYPAHRVHDLIKPIEVNYADIVVGDRRSGGRYDKENKRALHGFGNKTVKVLVNFLFNSKLNDIMSGYRVFSRTFVKSYPILVEGFEIETDMTLHALDKKFRIIEIPVEYKNRPEGSISKLNTMSDGFKVLFTIARILRYYRPLLFFSCTSLIFFIAGFLTGIPVFNDWIQYQFIFHIPLAILATGLEVIAVLMFAIGLILDSNSYQSRFNFELEINKMKVISNINSCNSKLKK
jgi:glycosyltransferase involved in cell wall biosynthesis